MRPEALSRQGRAANATRIWRLPCADAKGPLTGRSCASRRRQVRGRMRGLFARQSVWRFSVSLGTDAQLLNRCLSGTQLVARAVASVDVFASSKSGNLVRSAGLMNWKWQIFCVSSL